MTLTHARTLVAAIATAIGTSIVVGGVAAVQAAGTPKPLKACQTARHVLVLKAGKGCPKGSRAVTIAQQGPQGEPGPRGDTGAKGDSGARGPSDVYTNAAYASQGSANMPDVDGTTTVLSDLPAGSYLVAITFSAYTSAGGTGAYFYCHPHYVTADAELVGNTVFVNIPSGANSGGFNTDTGSLTEAVTLDANGDITLSCVTSGSATFTPDNFSITATRVGAVHPTSGQFSPHLGTVSGARTTRAAPER